MFGMAESDSLVFKLQHLWLVSFLFLAFPKGNINSSVAQKLKEFCPAGGSGG